MNDDLQTIIAQLNDIRSLLEAVVDQGQKELVEAKLQQSELAWEQQRERYNRDVAASYTAIYDRAKVTCPLCHTQYPAGSDHTCGICGCGQPFCWKCNP